MWVALSGAVIVGVLTAIQARMNGQLGLRLGDATVAAAISFGSGLFILLVLSSALAAGRRGAVRLVHEIRGRRIPWWMLAGGAAGAFSVMTQSLSVGIIGVSLFTVGAVAGQTLCGVVLDRIGFGPGGAVAVTVPRLIGGVLALAAVSVSLVGGAADGVPIWMLVLPFLVGAGIAWQQATNGRLRQRVGTPLTATLVNFVGGSAILVTVAVIHVGFVGVPAVFPPEAWLYLGGALGVVYIMMSAALVARTGVLLLGLCAVVGQLLTSVLLDALWPAASSLGFGQEAAMVTVALLSVVVAVAPWRARRS